MSLHDFETAHKREYVDRPHSIEAEQALLGVILLDNSKYEVASDIIDATAFYDPVHGELFRLIGQHIAAGRLATPITIKPLVENWRPILPDMSVWQYLGRLVSHAGRGSVAKDYAQAIRDFADRRALLDLADDIYARVLDSPQATHAGQIIEDAERALYAIGEQTQASREISFGDAAQGAVDMVAAACRQGGGISGLATGLHDLDAKLGGLHPSDLIIIGGRPGMGKSALAMTIAFNVASRTRESVSDDGEVSVSPQHVHFFSQEMSAIQLAMRQLSDRAEVASDAMRRGTLTQSQFDTLARHAGQLAKLPMTIDETGGISLASLSTKARRLKRLKGTSLLVIDYLQLMSGADKRSDNRVQEITKITMGLKALAKELNVPILALSQLSRALENRSDKRPQLADLRESGSIEQDADVVMFVYRDAYYVEREKPPETAYDEYDKWQARLESAHGKAEAIVAKQRHGPTGTVLLSFDSQFTRFGNVNGAT